MITYSNLMTDEFNEKIEKVVREWYQKKRGRQPSDHDLQYEYENRIYVSESWQNDDTLIGEVGDFGIFRDD